MANQKMAPNNNGGMTSRQKNEEIEVILTRSLRHTKVISRYSKGLTTINFMNNSLPQRYLVYKCKPTTKQLKRMDKVFFMRSM